MAASTVPWSLVGAWTEKPLSLNATTPITTLAGWCSTKSRAAALAASIRVGLKSSAAMLPDTSNARITVPSSLGRLTTPCGRVRAKTSMVMPRRNRPAGTRRRRRADLPVLAAASVPAAARPKLSVTRRRRLPMRRYSSTPTGMVASRRSMTGQMNDIGQARRDRR